MACYALSVLAAGGLYLIRRKGDSAELRSLNQMLLGGAVFGFVDHLWNGELFSSPNLVNDMMLGVAIVASILGIWATMTYGPMLLKRQSPVA
ncbi:Uncharacterised protein [uncultured archaeon]|nr:Uncharacterised protein [uncultured archaeon]